MARRLVIFAAACLFQIQGASDSSSESIFYKWNSDSSSTKEFIKDFNSQLTKDKTPLVIANVNAALSEINFLKDDHDDHYIEKTIHLEKSWIKNKYARIRLHRIKFKASSSDLLPIESTGKYTFQADVRFEKVAIQAYFTVKEQVSHFGAFCITQWEFWMPCKAVRRKIKIRATVNSANAHYEGGAKVYVNAREEEPHNIFQSLAKKFSGQHRLNYFSENLGAAWIDEIKMTFGEFTVPRNKEENRILMASIRGDFAEGGIFRQKYIVEAEKALREAADGILDRLSFKRRY